MRAYEMRPDGVTARVDDSAEDSMKHRSLTEEEGEMGGRAHRRGMVPRFRVLSNDREHVIGLAPSPGTPFGRRSRLPAPETRRPYAGDPMARDPALDDAGGVDAPGKDDTWTAPASCRA